MVVNVVFAQAFVDFDIVSFLTGGISDLINRVEAALRDQETLSYLLLAVSVLLIWRLITRIRWSRSRR